MNALEFHKLLSERLAKYGLTVKLATKSSHTLHTGVIMIQRASDLQEESTRPLERGESPIRVFL